MTCKIVLVGEAWGEREARFRHAFVGQSGVELARMLAAVGLAPEITVKFPSELDMIAHWKTLREVFGIDLANVFDARPQGNDIEQFFGKDGNRNIIPLRPGKYILSQYEKHVKELHDKLTSLAPNLIIAFGNTAAWAILNQTKIGAIRGTVQMSPLGIKCLPTYHPAAILRQWSYRPTALADLKKAVNESKSPELVRLPRWILIDPTLDEISNWIDKDADAYACDIETEFSQISMIGFARSRSDALVIPFHKPDGSSYWPSVDEEVAAWALVNRALGRPIPKIFQNGLYDLQYILRMGLRPQQCFRDTMLRHHALYPELPKALGFLGSIYCDGGVWKLMRGRAQSLKRDE